MSRRTYLGVEEARNDLPSLLQAAEEGQATVITRRGKPVAALVPLDQYRHAGAQQPLVPLERTGRNLWGRHPQSTLGRLRDEWSR